MTRAPSDNALLASATSPILLAGLYVWSVACAPLIAAVVSAYFDGRGASLWAVAAALFALVSLVAGVALEREKHRAAPLAGVWCFLGCCAASWALVPSAVDVARLDMLRGVLASAGFCLYALAWGVPDPLHKPRPEDDPRAEAAALAPRGHPSRSAAPLLTLGVAGAAALGVIAWGARDPTRAVVAHAAAGVSGVALVSAAGRVAVGRGESGPSGPRFRRAAYPFALASLIVFLGAGYALITR